jgi:hypothetical protein
MADVLREPLTIGRDDISRESKREQSRPGLLAHVACRVDGVVRVAELASYIRTWAQVAKVTGMWLSELFPIGSSDGDEWRLTDDYTGKLDPSATPVRFSMKRAAHEADVVLVWAAGEM